MTQRSDKERGRLKDQRVLIVNNLLNGVPDWQIAKTFHMDVKDVHWIFKFVMNKVDNYLFRLCKPPIFCDALAQAQRDRVNIMAILLKLNLDVAPEFSRIAKEVVNANNCESALNDIKR